VPANKAAGKKESRSPRRAAGKLNRVDHPVIAGLKTALAHARGEIKLPTRYVEIPDPVDVKAIRLKLGLSQSEFSKRFGSACGRYRMGTGAHPTSERRARLPHRHRPAPGDVLKALLGAA